MKNRYEDLDFETLKRLQKQYEQLDHKALRRIVDSMTELMAKDNEILKEMKWNEKT